MVDQHLNLVEQMVEQMVEKMVDQHLNLEQMVNQHLNLVEQMVDQMVDQHLKITVNLQVHNLVKQLKQAVLKLTQRLHNQTLRQIHKHLKADQPVLVKMVLLTDQMLLKTHNQLRAQKKKEPIL